MEQKIIPMIFNIIDLEENAKNGDGLSCYILGRSYDSGENGVKQNFEKALYCGIIKERNLMILDVFMA